MSKILAWQQRIVDREKTMSNEELFDEVLALASGDDYDGGFTQQGYWEYQYMQSKLRKRLADWLMIK